MKGKKITKTAIRRSIPLYLLLLPSFVLLFCFSYLPLGGLVMAFERY
ncbi:MAG: sugar ABC transporter permease, partial [Lachnospiraceae bacterium]|nr:sugar ABC transporter permease [Lachnospiraceae bacterium]